MPSQGRIDGSGLVIPPGREAEVMRWIAPISERGFAGLSAGRVAIPEDHVLIELSGQSPASCPQGQEQAFSSFLAIRRAADGHPPVLRGRAGGVDAEGLRLEWSLCPASAAEGQDEQSLREQAEELVAALASTEPPQLWVGVAVGPERGPPPWPPWLAALLCALVLAAVAISVRKWQLWIAVLGLLPLAGYCFSHVFFAPLAPLLWAPLLPLSLWALWRVAHKGKTHAAAFLVVFGVSLVLRVWAEGGPANWYVDYLGPMDAVQQAWTQRSCGLVTLLMWLAAVFPISPEAVYLGSALCSSLAIGFFASALASAPQGDKSLWPRSVPWAFGLLAAASPTLVWVGTTDAPHNIALLALSLALFFCRGSLPGLTIAVVFLMSALVGLTREDLLLSPLVVVFFLLPRLRGKRLVPKWVAASALAGIAASGFAHVDRAAGHLWDHAPATFAELAGGFWVQSPFAAKLGLAPAPGAALLFALFLVVCWSKRHLLWLLPLYGILILPKVFGGFAGARLGGFDPSQRYNLVLFLLMALMAACGLAFTWEWLRNAARSRWQESTESKARVLVGVAFVVWALVPGVIYAAVGRKPHAFEAELSFLSEELHALPAGATVSTVWLRTLRSGRDGDIQLAAPHGLLQHLRPDIRWVVLEPQSHLDAGTFFFRSASCSLDPHGQVRSGRVDPADAQHVARHVALCDEVIQSGRARLVSSRDRDIEQGTWPLAGGRARLALYRIE